MQLGALQHVHMSCVLCLPDALHVTELSLCKWYVSPVCAVSDLQTARCWAVHLLDRYLFHAETAHSLWRAQQGKLR